ncbi:hypothetical protein [Kitasatospora azatica]|uniref:hypothetical protein n=1 Tax=Kitasatospora azatica TaxID=58347 RepID=UPI00055E452F|nr:hypothetical protein [Kitasatospora azatica]
MSEDEAQHRPGAEYVKFRMPCPCCDDGTRTRVRGGARPHVHRDGSDCLLTGTGFVPQTCGDCGGKGFLPLGSGEWKGRPEPGVAR